MKTVLTGFLLAWATGVRADGPWITATLDHLPLGEEQPYWNGADESGGFRDQGIRFFNQYDTNWHSWGGFAYSRVNDTETADWENQYAVYHPGTDVSGTGVYAVVYDDGPWSASARLDLDWPSSLQSVHLNNTTYAALDMLHGGWFSKQFGGHDGTDPDWFKLTITGRDLHDNLTGLVEFYLADYRFGDERNYVVDEWTEVPLAELGANISRVEFALSSSDIGDWGMNTPAYFAMDNLTYRHTFSGPMDPDHPLDAAVPGFVGTEGDGLTNAPNYVNAAFGAWATGVAQYAPSTGGVAAAWSDPTRALGPVSGDHFNIVSLGDLTAEQIANGDEPGFITLTFDAPIANGPGPDFVVFENGIHMGGDRLFAELAYAEVSTDGSHFVRFPSISLTPEPVGEYGPLDATHVYNLAGKHVNAHGNSWGTPFDLATLANHPGVLDGTLDLDNVRYVRLVDIPGSGDFHDDSHPPNPIYDAWPTWGSGGFDLEAVGVLNSPAFHKVFLEVEGPGSITPYGQPLHAVAVAPDEHAVFHIIPDEHAHIHQVVLDGISLGRTNEVHIRDITHDRLLSVRFGPPITTRGVPHEWFARFGLTNQPPEIMQEVDSSGNDIPNWREYFAGTHPTDSNSVFRMTSIRFDGEAYAFTWIAGTHGSQRPFQLWRTDDLHYGHWEKVAVDIERSATGTNFYSLPVDQEAAAEAAYFRIGIAYE